MADISITAASVVPGTGAIIKQGTAGVALTAGQTVYVDPSTGNIKKANALTSATTAACVGIAVNNAAANQPVNYQVAGQITIGATVTTGAIYLASGNNDGGICPAADVTTGWYTDVLAIAISTTVFQIYNVTPGVAHS